MNVFRSVSIAAATIACAALAAGANAQSASTPTPEAKVLRDELIAQAKQPSPQGFSVVLVLGDSQSTTVADNVPHAARKALSDMKDFLPYRGYRLLDAQWILGSQRSASRLRGPDDQEYQLTLRTMPQPGRISVTFQLQEADAGPVLARDVDESAARRAAEADLRARLEQLQREAATLKGRAGERAATVQTLNAEIDAIKQRLATPDVATFFRRRTVIDTSFTMDIGETVVVGTSRMRGGDKALIALLTAVPKATK